jgi:hypothetical protein
MLRSAETSVIELPTRCANSQKNRGLYCTVEKPEIWQFWLLFRTFPGLDSAWKLTVFIQVFRRFSQSLQENIEIEAWIVISFQPLLICYVILTTPFFQLRSLLCRIWKILHSLHISCCTRLDEKEISMKICEVFMNVTYIPHKTELCVLCLISVE